MKEFDTAVKEVTEVDEGTTFKITTRDAKGKITDETELLAYKPSDGQLAMLMASLGRGSSETDSVAGVINFFVKVLDSSGARYIENRLLDRADTGFELEQVEDIMEWLVEEWSGRPTQPLTVSTQSPPSDGPKSTPPTPESTSSGSLLMGS